MVYGTISVNESSSYVGINVGVSEFSSWEYLSLRKWGNGVSPPPTIFASRIMISLLLRHVHDKIRFGPHSLGDGGAKMGASKVNAIVDFLLYLSDNNKRKSKSNKD